MRKDRTFSPMLSKWEYFCQNGQIIRPFLQKYSHSDKTGKNCLSFSQHFPMIFPSVTITSLKLNALGVNVHKKGKTTSTFTNGFLIGQVFIHFGGNAIKNTADSF